MALKKEKQLENGLSGNYWVAEPRVNAITKQTEVIMLLFKDKEARDSGKTFILRERVSGIDGVYLTGEQIYSKIKESKKTEITEESPEQTETNWFADSEDC